LKQARYKAAGRSYNVLGQCDALSGHIIKIETSWPSERR